MSENLPIEVLIHAVERTGKTAAVAPLVEGVRQMPEDNV